MSFFAWLLQTVLSQHSSIVLVQDGRSKNYASPPSLVIPLGELKVRFSIQPITLNLEESARIQRNRQGFRGIGLRPSQEVQKNKQNSYFWLSKRYVVLTLCTYRNYVPIKVTKQKGRFFTSSSPEFKFFRWLKQRNSNFLGTIGCHILLCST